MIKKKNDIYLKKGFTLIEVIISVALLGIISIAFLMMFSNGLIGISDAGRKSTNHYTAQNQIEKNIDNSGEQSGGTVSTASYNSMVLTFSGTPYPSVSGRKVDVTYTYGKNTKILTTFTTK